ncbi:MAG: TatD family hydrolase [Alistipes sp.]|nr:TatD family hydrolase [Alistipes sp.]
MGLVDTHCHLYDEQFDTDRAEAVTRAREAGVERLVLPAIDHTTDAAQRQMVCQYPDLCRPMIGVHPSTLEEHPEWFAEELARVERDLATPPEGMKFCAIGEIGLDFYWSRAQAALQQQALRQQLEWALEYGLPVAIHTRDAWDAMCRLLEEFRGRGLRGVMHSFCGTLEHYRRIGAVGDFYFGIGGPVTYKKSAVAALLPAMDPARLVLETDCPYLPPVPFRGKRNESSYLIYVRDAIAQHLGLTPDEVAQITTQNAFRLFGA